MAPLLTLGRRHLTLCTSPPIDSPCVLGFLHPRLLLPAHLPLSPADLHSIVLHEREHLLRHDDWINLLQRLALILFPLSPALHLIDRHLGAERELACDTAVIAQTAAPLPYASCLTRLAEHRLRSLALSLSTFARRSELTRRIEQLLAPTRTPSPARLRLTTAAVALALFGSSVELARAPHLITFATSSPAAVATNTPLPAFNPGPRAIPAAFHPGAAGQPRAELLRTLILSPAATPHRAHHRATRLTPPAQTLRTSQLLPAATPRAILTAATTSRQQQTAAQPAVLLTTDFARYAAVPFAGGWLVIQL